MPEVETPDDGALVSRLVARETAALGEAYDRYGRAVYAVALRVLRQPGEAEEVVQDTFKALWQHATALQEREGNVLGWLVTTARRAAIDLWRKRQRRIPSAVNLSAEAVDAASATAAVEDHAGLALERGERAERVRAALAVLPAEQAEILRLAFFSGWSHQEIADRLELPLGTVKSRVRYGLQKLQSSLEGAGHE